MKTKKNKMCSVVKFFVLLAISFIFVNCEKKENDNDPEPTKIDVSIIPDITIFKSISIAGGSAIDAFSQVTIAFNRKMASNYSYNENMYRAMFDSIVIFNDGIAVSVDTTWNQQKDTLLITHSIPLVPATKVSIKILMHWELLIDGTWVKCSKDSVDIYEDQEFTYTVSSLPGTIVEDDIEVTYPLKSQYHFLKNEYSKGLLKFKRNRRDLFSSPVFTSGDVLKVLISNQSGTTFTVDATYFSDKLMIEYYMPQDLNNEEIYHVQIIKRNDTKNLTTIYYEYYFRTSQFNTFEEKYNIAFTSLSEYFWTWPNGVNALDVYIQYLPGENEQIDYYESKVGTIINMEFIIEGNDWYKNCNLDVLYSLISSGKYKITNRNEKPYGIPPVYYFAAYRDSLYNNVILDESAIVSNNTPRINSSEYLDYGYKGAAIFRDDYNNVKNQIRLKGAPYTTEEQTILDGDIKLYTQGYYYFNMYYKIPGTEIITTTKQIKKRF